MFEIRAAKASGVNDDKITCPLSMTRTVFVLRPNDASMSCPLSLTSCITRFIGADSGLTAAIIRSADTILPNPMLTSFNARSSLYVLNLLSYLLNLRLEVDDDMGNVGVLALGARGVCLTVKLLKQEVYLSADG